MNAVYIISFYYIQNNLHNVFPNLRNPRIELLFTTIGEKPIRMFTISMVLAQYSITAHTGPVWVKPGM
ncbi:hypothetical protein D3C87_1031080 [compost metagenome]